MYQRFNGKRPQRRRNTTVIACVLDSVILFFFLIISWRYPAKHFKRGILLFADFVVAYTYFTQTKKMSNKIKRIEL